MTDHRINHLLSGREAVARVHGSWVFLTALALFMTALCWATTPASAADVPGKQAAEFTADRCAGTTSHDPAIGTDEIPNLLRVFGQRLDDYNDGKVVPLYQYDGSNALGEFSVPLCTVRYVAEVGPVSEWAYCTDRHADPCGYSRPDGGLGASDGTPIDGMRPGSGNPRLTPDQEKLIAAIVHTPITLASGSQTIGGITYASPASDEGENNRLARQLLVWCISDPFASGTYRNFCNTNMSTSRQAEVLAAVPDSPELAFAADPRDRPVGETAPVTLATNIHDSPISLTVTGGTVSVCPSSAGGATLLDDELTVTDTDPTAATSIDLCVSASAEGTVTVTASATPPSVQHISWNRSPGTQGIVCQVFATFETTQQVTLTDTASLGFTKPTPTPTPTPTPSDTPTPTPTSTPTPTLTDTPTEAPPTGSSTPVDGPKDGTPHTSFLPNTGGPSILLGAATLFTILLGAYVLVRERRRRLER